MESFAKPKISSQFLRANGILKFVAPTKNLIFTKKVQANFKIYYQAYHGSKFSGKMKNLNSVNFQGDCIKAHKFKRNFSAKISGTKILKFTQLQGLGNNQAGRV